RGADFEAFQAKRAKKAATPKADKSKTTAGPGTDEDKKSEGKDPLSLLLIKLALDNAELFHDAGGDCYADVKIGDHCETHKLGSREFKDWLAGLLYRTTERAVSGDKIAEAVTVLRAQARYESQEIEAHVRV